MRYIAAPWREQYVTNAVRSKGCVFCDALKAGADRTTKILFRGVHHFIILNRFPYNTGHLMIAPYRHGAAVERTSPEAAAELMELMKTAIRILRKRYRPQGFNAGMNLGRSAGAGVAGHYHLHVIPRWTGDANFLPLIGGTKVVTEDLETTYERLFPLFAKERMRLPDRKPDKPKTPKSR